MADTNRIPPFDGNGNLPPGVHQVFLGDIEERFTWTEKRKELYQGFVKAVLNLASAGVLFLYVGGSFVTKKDEPDDIDGCWVPNANINVKLLDEVFYKNRKFPRAKMKEKYGVDFLVYGYDLGADGRPIEGWFETDEDGNEKGILLLKL